MTNGTGLGLYAHLFCELPSPYVSTTRSSVSLSMPCRVAQLLCFIVLSSLAPLASQAVQQAVSKMKVQVYAYDLTRGD